MKKTRLALLVLAVLLPAAIAGCGGSSTNRDLAGLASPGSLVYVEVDLTPSGEMKSDVDSLAQTIGGIDDLGDYVVSQLEESARDDGESLDFDREVKPWLGERAAVAFKGLRDGDLTEPLVAIQTTDAAAAWEFVARQADRSNDPYKASSYEGIDFEVGGSEGDAIGVVGNALVIADGERGFKATVDASKGESLGDESQFQEAIAAASDGSLADVYVDVGELIVASDAINLTAREFLRSAGIDSSEATAVASLIPGSDQVEIDLSSDLSGEKAPAGDASGLLASMPASAFAAFGLPGFGEQLSEALDQLDASGIPGTMPPHQLKSSLAQAGIDLDQIPSSLEDGAVFAEGTSESDLGGALVLTTSSEETVRSIRQIGKLVRAAGASRVTAITGKASGFSVRSEGLGHYPLVVVVKDKRIVVGYGLRQTLKGLDASAQATLGDSPAYEDAVAALGDTPISAFVDGPAALRLAESLVPRSESGFWEAVPYLKKIDYVAIGSGADGEQATAKAIAGIEG